ncbi:MAG: hypothetical protein EAY66_08485 [Sphingobacteriales bacterium]|nr:MAG: hypothetical protein EAY66_08485 [Sphingobacteriales bacterium]
MQVDNHIRYYATQPITHNMVMEALAEYQRPNDKIHQMLNQGVLSAIRKGLYIAGPALMVNKPEPFLLANHIMGPSCISLDSALAYHQLIPERVYQITSVTTKASRSFNTPEGLFSYTRLPLPYYSFGIQQVSLLAQQTVMMVMPEKALCDKIITTSGIIFRSQKMAMAYLLENLRIDESSLQSFDTNIMRTWLPNAPKKDTLLMLIKTLEHL